MDSVSVFACLVERKDSVLDMTEDPESGPSVSYSLSICTASSARTVFIVGKRWETIDCNRVNLDRAKGCSSRADSG